MELDHPYNVFGAVHLVACETEHSALEHSFSCFRADLGSIFKFCSILDAHIDASDDSIAFVTGADAEAVTNAVLLLGSYMIMRLGAALPDVVQSTAKLVGFALTYRDVSPGPQNFHLHVHDCWRGLARARDLGWVCFDEGHFDVDEYDNFDSPLNADLHEVVPGKLIAFRGPKDLPNDLLCHDAFVDGVFDHRDFSPQHYTEILEQFDVQAIVRLNEPAYDRQAFINRGIAVADLFFEDCTNPPVDVVAKFLAIAESVPGALAVHCKAGLGRTGTLIALCMMRQHGFTARETMGWLRIVRPGSVIGSQQNFLCAREPTMRGAGQRICCVGTVGRDASVGQVQKLIDGICSAVDRRYTSALAANEVGMSTESMSSESATLAEHVFAASGRRAARRSCH